MTVIKKYLLHAKIMASQASGSTAIMSPTDYFGVPLAKLPADKISAASTDFNGKRFVINIQEACSELSLTQRVELIADQLKKNLPGNSTKATRILHTIMGPENPNETRMFKNFYWLLPVEKFIENMDWIRTMNRLQLLKKLLSEIRVNTPFAHGMAQQINIRNGSLNVRQ